MLVLSRKEGSQLMIGDDIVVKVSKIRGNRVSLAIEAPSDVSIRRGELVRVGVADRESRSDRCSGGGGSASPNVAAYHA